MFAGSVICSPFAHVETDECGAPEFFSNGSKLLPASGAGARLDPRAVERLFTGRRDLHFPKPRAMSVSQATELGTVYRAAELRELWELARSHDVLMHMDGARFSNAVATLGCAPADLTWRAGVDVLSLGATKNGAMAAEAVVFFDLSLLRDFELRRKRAAHLLSKMRYVSAQLLAYVETGVWRRNAAHANALAQELGAAAGRLLRVDQLGADHLYMARQPHRQVGAGAHAGSRRRGFLLGLSPQEVIRVLQPVLVQAAA